MAQRAKQKKADNTATDQLTRLGNGIAAWWWGLPAPQRRSYCATTGGLIAVLMLVGLLPAARHSWVAILAGPANALLGWGATPALLTALTVAGAIIAETVLRQAIVRAGWLWCAAVALLLALTESRLLFGSPLGGFLGALGAWPLRRLPAVAAQLGIVGAFLLDALIAFRISWHELRQTAQWLTKRTIEPPSIPTATSMGTGVSHREQPPPLSSPGIGDGEYAMPSPSHIAPLTPQQEGHAWQAPTGHAGDLSTDQAIEALRVPAYLRRGAVPQHAAPASQVDADKDFALPPLPLRQTTTTPEPSAATTLRAASIGAAARQPTPANLSSASHSPVPTDVTATAADPVLPPLRALRDEPYQTTWSLPPLSLLNASAENRPSNAIEHAGRLATIIERTLKSFGVDAEVRRSDISVGPTIMRFGIRPSERVRTDERGRAMVDAQGEPIIVRTRVSRIMSLKDDLALVLEVKTLRMEAPVPERPYIGVEIPNVYGRMVTVREVLESLEFTDAAMKSKLCVVLGRDVAGRVRVGDLARFPHVLIAGATGAGKSVCLNAIISSLITQATPHEVRLVMIDPKMVELMMYDGIPHLLTPVITDPRRVVGVLDAAICEMERRYRLFSRLGVRNLDGYAALRAGAQTAALEPLPRIVLIIDELADLMMVAADDIERQICRLAQLARATGIHLVVATQRPSVDVITGLIKANIPTRVAFMTSSLVDSRTILDAGGAEHLLGKGDMLFLASDAAKAERIQGAYVADDEVERLARFWRKQADALGIATPQWDIPMASDYDE